MRKEYDFTKAVRKNPYIEKMKNGYSVTIHYSSSESNNEEKQISANVPKPISRIPSSETSSLVSE
jgi:hypothetical protein